MNQMPIKPRPPSALPVERTLLAVHAAASSRLSARMTLLILAGIGIAMVLALILTHTPVAAPGPARIVTAALKLPRPRVEEQKVFDLTPEAAEAINAAKPILPGTPAKARPYLRTPFNEFFAKFSPELEPHWVAYQSDETGRTEIYVQSFPEPGAKVKISTAGGINPAWGPDGREIFYVSPDSKLLATTGSCPKAAIKRSCPMMLVAITRRCCLISGSIPIGCGRSRSQIRS